MAIDHDGLFKQLLSTFFKEFLELFAPDVLALGDPDTVSLAESESVTDAHASGQSRADLVVKMDFRAGGQAFFIIHVEVQSQTHSAFAKRMHYYFARLHHMHDAAVYPIAVLTFDARNRDEPDEYRVSFPTLDVLSFRFQKVHLRKLDWRKYLDRANPVAAALMAKMGYTKRERARVKVECIRLLAMLRLGSEKTSLISRFVETYLALDEAELNEYNEIVEAMPVAEKQAVTEIMNHWERVGLEKGLERGLEQGLQSQQRLL